LNASNFKNAGADIVQELAYGLSMANEYMSNLTGRDIPADLAASKIRFSFGLGSNYFFEIAKLRTARLLWAVITGAYKTVKNESARMEIHCVTSEWNKTVYDPYVNLLRTQTEAMSAALGGTDSMTVEPFDIVFKEPDEFSERIARNQQILLKEESYFDKVIDPAAGSYYIEKLTAMIAENAWKEFLEIEEQGGFLSALKSGFIQRRIKESAVRRKADISKRKEILLGTNQYPDFNETLSHKVDIGRVFSSTAEENENIVEPIRLFRGSEEFDRLRIIADKTDKRPVAFMLTIGNFAMRKARSQFSCNFFACGGYKVIDNNGFNTVEEGVGAALAASADIVVVCSSDEEYAVFAPAVFEKLQNKAIVVIAGNPGSVDELKSKGLEYFISVRSNIIETLEFFNIKLGLCL
jgi:methylmalonyl-CoA mutase